MKKNILFLAINLLAFLFLQITAKFGFGQCTCPGGLGWTCVPANDVSASWLSGFPTANVYFLGNFTVNTSSFTISGKHVVCNSACTITINSGCTLTLTSSTNLSLDAGCSSLWGGIVNNGNFVMSSTSSISTAQTALLCNSGSSFTISNSTFDKNYVGIAFNNVTGTYSGTITGTTFSSLTSGSPAPIGVSPYTTVRSHIGIDVSGADLVIIGAIASSPNVFDNLDYGVYSSVTPHYGGAEIYLANFYRCKTGTQSGVSHPAAIHIINSGTPSLVSTLTVDGANIGDATNGNHRGIDIDGPVNVTLSGIGFVNESSYGLLMTNNKSTTFDITDCYFDDVHPSAIYLHENPGTSATHTTHNIHSITITNALTSTGIIDAEATSPNYVDLIIEDCYPGSGYYISDLENGIQLMRIKQYLTSAMLNTNSVTDVSDIAVSLTNCNGIKIVSNEIAGNNTGKGISVDNSKGTFAYNNSISFESDGYYGINDLQNSNLICNRIDNCLNGVRLDAVSAFGPVGSTTAPSDNRWTNIDPLGYGIASDGGTNGNNFHWYSIDPNPSNCYFPNPVPASTQTVPGVYNGFAVPITLICHASSCSLYYKLDSVDELITDRNTMLYDIVHRTGSYANLTEMQQYMDDVFAFETLSEDTEYLSLGTDDDIDYQNYYSSLQNTNIATLYNVGISLKSDEIDFADSLNSSINPGNDRESYLQELFEIYFRTLAVDSPFSVGDSSDLLSIAYLDPNETGDAPFMAQAMLGLLVSSDDQRLSRPINESMIEKLEISPNPTESILQYKINLYQPVIYEMRFYDLSGVLLDVKTILSPYGNIDVSNLTKGIYLVELRKDGKLASIAKLIKN